MTSTRLEKPDLADLKPANAKVFVELLSLDAIRRLRDTAATARETIARKVERVRQEIQAIDSRLKPDVVADLAHRIRLEGDAKMADAARTARQAAATAEEQRVFYTRRAVMRRTPAAADRTAAATIRAGYTAWLQRIDQVELVEVAEEAAGSGDIALLEAVRVEMHARQGEQILSIERRHRIMELVHAVPLPEAAEALELIDETQQLADDAMLAMQESRDGRTNPMRKLQHAMREQERQARGA